VLSDLIVVFMLVTLVGDAGVVASPRAHVAAPTRQASAPRLLTEPVADPHETGVMWFAPTGHTLRGAFLDYWNKYGGLAQFGYPITEEFTEPTGPANNPVFLMVQYFERNRFEHHPENAGTPYEVLLGTLGRDFHAAEPPVPQSSPPGAYFPETGHNLSGAFKAYWDSHGSLFVHGYPITEAFQEKNPIDHKTYLVQYFERSRFELHPENAGSQYEVLLGLLGTQLTQKNGYSYGWYPRHGHAANFSWITGQVQPNQACAAPVCQCNFVSDIRVQPLGPGWTQALRAGKANPRAFVVVFGRLAVPGDPTDVCPAPGYLAEQVQSNPPQ